jgi:hypothetical protein
MPSLPPPLKDVIQHILQESDLQEIQKYPICMRQIELHWKLCATVMRCGEGNTLRANKLYEKIIHSAESRGHFVNLNKTDD